MENLTSNKIKNIIDSQLREDINSAIQNDTVSRTDYEELLDILVEVSKLEALNQAEI